jgi:hypothetical protein
MRRILVAALIVCGTGLVFGQADSSASNAQTAPASAPAAGVGAPETLAPDSTNAAAGTTAPAADTQAPAPDAAAPAPDATAPAPDATAPAPDATAPAPDATAPAPDATAPAPGATAPAPDAAAPAADATAPAPDATAPAAAPAQADALAEVERLSAKLEEANAAIDGLKAESDDLRAKLRDAEEKAKASEALSEASDAQRKAAEASAARADAAEAESASLRSRSAELETRIKALEAERDALSAKLASFGGLKIDPSRYPELLRSGFDGSKARLGSWKLSGGVLAQTDSRQFFSRLTFPLLQSAKPVLYSFETRTGKKGWVGTGIHFFAEGVKKPKGYGEGTSLLVWLTRDAKVRGNDGTYLQVYRFDYDVNMERVLDAKVGDRLDGWNRIEVLYEPDDEFIVIAVNGSVRAAYRTYFGIGTGVTMSLRSLGAGVQFRNLEVRR